MAEKARDDTQEKKRVTIDRYADALAAYADDVPPRPVIPSVRQFEAGDVPDDFRFRPAPPPPEVVKQSIFRLFIENLKQLNPRGIATRETMLPLIVLGFLQTAGQFDNTAFAVLLVFIRADMEFDFAFMFGLLGMLGVLANLAAPAMGYLADRVSRVWMVRIGSLLDNLSSVAAGLAPGPGALVGSQVVAGIAPAIHAPAAAPLIADYFPPDRRARVFGFIQVLGLVWGTFSTLLLIACIIYWDVSWRVVLVVSGGVATFVTLFTFLLRDPVRGGVDRIAMGADAESAAEEQSAPSWAEAWRTAASIGTLRRMWFATPALTLSRGAIGVLLFYAIQTRIATGGDTGILGKALANPEFAQFFPVLSIVGPALITMLVLPFAASFADRLLAHRPGRVMYYAGLLQIGMGLGLVGMVAVPEMLVAWLFIIVFQALALLITPAENTLLSLVIPARIRGLGMQTLAPFRVLGSALLFVVGRIAVDHGATGTMMLMLPVLLAGGLLYMSAGSFVERDIRAALAASMADQESRRARAAGRNKMLVVRDVDVTYAGTQVLFNVNLDVEEGELIALLGTNGAGKSTLLRAIAGIHEASNGAVFLDGEDVTHKPSHLNAREGIVFLPGGRAVFPTLTVEENLRCAAYLETDTEAEDSALAARTEEILDLFPILRERMGELAGNMSGGEQQMLALAQSFLMRPRLLMIDELSLGLAPAVVSRLLDAVRRIHEQGTTVILVEQSVNVALTVAQRAVFMEKGEIRFDGPTEELLGRGDLVRAVFLGGTGGTFVGLGIDQRTGISETVLRATDLAVSYGGITALAGASLHVGDSEIVGIIGPNGAGKTTLFDVVSGFTAPDRGSIEIAGVDATGLAPELRAALGLARSFQDSRLFGSLTVREAVLVALERRLSSKNAVLAAVWAPSVRNSERRAVRRVEHLIDLLNLGGFADKFVSELSTGTRRMVDLACIMASEPKLLLLDEPSSGLAQAEIELLGPAVQRLSREAGCGVLVIEHDIPLVTAMADRLIAMELGTVLAEGPPDEVVSDERVVRSYLNADASVIQRSGALERAVNEALP